MTTEAAVSALKARMQRVCDALGARGRPPAWTLGDVTAVRALLRELEQAGGRS